MNTIHEINCFEQCKSCSAPSLFFTKMFLVWKSVSLLKDARLAIIWWANVL
jgi:hypothetical protein